MGRRGIIRYVFRNSLAWWALCHVIYYVGIQIMFVFRCGNENCKVKFLIVFVDISTHDFTLNNINIDINIIYDNDI